MGMLDGPHDAAHRISHLGVLGFGALWLIAGAALLFGGGTKNDLFTDLFLQALAVAALLLALSKLRLEQLSNERRQLILIACAVALVPLLQVVPMPYFFWSWLPGRSEIFAAQSAAGVQSFWQPYSLDPAATLAAFRSLLPALAVVALGMQLRLAQLRRIGLLVLPAALLMVPIGIAQVAGGPHSPLRPYLPTNPHDAVGLFANRNHYAALMVVALMMALTYARAPIVPLRRSIDNHLWIGACLLVGSILLLGIVLSRSRAGFLFAGFGVAAMLLLASLQRREQPKYWSWLIGFSVLASLVAFQFGFLAIADRLATLGGSDLRWNVAPSSLSLAAHFGFLGSGIGTYPAAYAAFEPLEKVTSLYVNHAHNDYLELLVDAGVVFVALLLWFARFLWRLGASIRWRDLQSEQVFRAGAFLALCLLLAHSFFDYPLRTTALSVVFAWLLVVLVAPATEPQTREKRR